MRFEKTSRWSSISGTLLGVLIGITSGNIAQAQDRAAQRSAQGVPASIEALRLNSSIRSQSMRDPSGVLSPALVGISGSSRVIVRLTLPSVGKMVDKSEGAQLSRKLNIEVEQDALLARFRTLAPNLKVIARTQIVLNAVFVEVDASLLPELAKDPAVARIAPVANYEIDLTDTVPYIGAAAAQANGIDGSGVKVAVLDSGIDYNHANLGGSGDPLDHANNDPTIVEPGSFPTAKVVGGYDFTGSVWPNGPEMPDPDPLDDGPGGGHGTHVADIIGGAGGVAPGVDLYAVKVCSSVSSSCSGIALIQGMEFAVDPNGDGNTNDAMDIINMSLGSLYGQPFDDDLVLAVEAASAVGVLTVASAGNSADKPYITGTPAAAPSALSVAQTQVPSAFAPQYEVTAPAGITGLYDAVFQPWSAPLNAVTEAPMVYGDGAGGNLDGCLPFAPGTFSNEIVLVDRGACSFSVKIDNIGQGGGVIGIIGLVAPGDPFPGGFGGGNVVIPGYMISQADADTLRTGVPDTTIKFDPAVGTPLIGTMVSSSSRGPSNFYQMIKPEIGAPGASVSAEYATGTGETPFGGTSGAAPMVAGSAALLIDSYCHSKKGSKGKKSKKGSRKSHCMPPGIAKALLVNNGDINIDTDPFSGLAPITRIGGGEVRVDAAILSSAFAYDRDTRQGALSFGFHDVADGTITLKKHVTIQGTGRHKGSKGSKGSKGGIKWTVTPTFRYAEDAANGAVSVSVSKSTVMTKGRNKSNIMVEMTIDGSLLPGNFMNSGSEGANGSALTANEYDGYLEFSGDNGETIRMPWQVLPRQAARVKAPHKFKAGGFPTMVGLYNTGVGTAQIDGYSLLATSPKIPSGPAGGQAPTPDLAAFGVQTYPVPAGFCSAEESFIWAFAVNTHERQSHVVPVAHQVTLDTNQDGAGDYWVYNFSVGFDFGDGRQVTYAEDIAAGTASAFFFAEHATNTGNTVLLICGEQIGLTGTDLLATNVDVLSVDSFDVYFGGPGDNIPGPITITPLGEQYFPESADIPGNSAGAVDIYDYGPFPGNSPELGVLLNTNGDRGAGARGGATEDTEATAIFAK